MRAFISIFCPSNSGKRYIVLYHVVLGLIMYLVSYRDILNKAPVELVTVFTVLLPRENDRGGEMHFSRVVLF